ncbi:amidohydrolase family protein [Streptomyces sp. NPDC006435]|uniref:amidohydrolase family protein n=1 Tax=Streptomyces sp. NPDC006435 TaxID=3154300 RepID=UPI00339F32A2
MTQQDTAARATGAPDATDQVFQVETHGIDPIPDEDRHGSAKDLFWLWFGSNLTFTYVINGALAVAFGLSFWQATGVVVIGGLAFFAISAAGLSGVRTGTATPVISRAPFGVRGNWPAGMLNWVVGIGYTILNTVVGTLALEAFFADLGWESGRTGRALALLVTLALTFAVALWGHATVQFAERWIAYVPAVGFAALLVFLLPGTDTGGGAAQPGASGWSLALVVMLAGPFPYVPMPADCTRYLPRTTSTTLPTPPAARRHDDDRVRVGPLKLYIDDVVEPRTAALLEPYAGCRHHRGETFYPPEEFADLLAKLDARGFQCFVHATGDRGIRTVLDAVEHARAVNGARDARHQIVHVECLDPEDTPRFAELGVMACMQPRHSAPEVAGPGKDWAQNVGADRWHKAWPLRSLHTAGAVLALSSDWNVAEMDPMIGIHTAVTRRPLGGGEPWMPQETISVEAAVHGYTMGSAYANFLEDERGSLTVGKAADFVVLSRDILRAGPEDIPGTIALTVVVAGVVEHEA